MPSDGPRYPGTVTTQSVAPESDNDWTTPGNIAADDGAEATVTHASFDSGDNSWRLKAQNLGFAIPAGATIDGITVEVQRRRFAGGGEDFRVQLLDAAGALVGDNKADTVTAWGTTSTTITYGGAADGWNASPTPAMVNNPDFGVAFGALATAANTDIGVDFIRVTVDYSESAITLTPDPVVISLGTPAPALAGEVAPAPTAMTVAPATSALGVPVTPSPAVASFVVPAASLAAALAPSAVAIAVVTPDNAMAIPLALDPVPLALAASAPTLGGSLTPPAVAVPIALPAVTMEARAALVPVGLSLAIPAPGLAILLAPAPVPIVFVVPPLRLEIPLTILPVPVPLTFVVPAPTLSGILAVEPIPLVIDLLDAILSLGLSLDPASLELSAPAPSLGVGIDPAPVPIELVVIAPVAAIGRRPRPPADGGHPRPDGPPAGDDAGVSASRGAPTGRRYPARR